MSPNIRIRGQAMKVVGRLALALAALTVAVFPAVAYADIIAVTQQRVPTMSSAGEPTGGTNLDLAAIDVSTGQRTALAALDTTADEFHPSMSSDGRLVVFERVDPVTLAVRIIMLDRTTGQQADLFSAADAALFRPNSPSISPDGSRVVVGEPKEMLPFCPEPTSVIVVNVRAFPTGPFPRSETANFNAPCKFENTDVSVEPSIANDGTLAWTYVPTDLSLDPIFETRISLMPSGEIFGAPEKSPIDPAIRPGTTSTIVFSQYACSSCARGDLWSRTLGAPTATSKGETFSKLPIGFSFDSDLSRAQFTPDGRYLGFVLQELNPNFSLPHPLNDSLVVWDTVTNTMITKPIPLGAPTSRFTGSLALYEQPVFTVVLSCCQTIRFDTAQPTSAGLLIQRIVGNQQLLGKTAPKLEVIGRFPLGKFRRGANESHWNFTVGGHQLAPGRYYVTLRAITEKLGVRDLSTPFLVTIRKGKLPIVSRVR
jgi:hypothetical protein